MISFADLALANLTRNDRWMPNGIAQWSISQWAVAMAGEAGEVCNAVKKLNRIEEQVANLNEPGRRIEDRAAAIAKIGDEIADTVIYLDLLAQRCGLNLGDLIPPRRRRSSPTTSRTSMPRPRATVTTQKPSAPSSK
jgi:NTP pyrophosphatase (non-canonical NTP hydrolase)